MIELASLDWNAVAAAIRYTDAKTPLLLEFDYEQVAEAVLKAADHWALRDAERYEILAVEKKFEVPLEVAGSTRIISGILDLELREWATGAELNVDWKTRNAKEFGETWADRYRSSWQGRLYGWVKGRSSLEWRGICRESCAVKTVAVTYPVEDGEWVKNQLAGVIRQMDALSSTPIWPMKRPSSCGAFGRVCDFRRLCDGGANPPQAIGTSRLSNTDMETFLLCPERYRLGEVTATRLDEEVDDRSALDFGLAFHRGIAVVYEQLKEAQHA